MPSLDIRFTQDPELLAKAIVFTARSIQLDKFSQGNYVVLPRLLAGKRKAIYFPDLSYTPKFWSDLAKLKDYSLTKPYPQFCIDFVKIQLKNYISPQTNLIQDWQDKFANYSHFINSIFSENLLKKVASIDILLTEFGSPGTFSRTHARGGPVKLICTARTDLGPENILQVIVNCLITITQPGYADVGTIAWYQRNAIVNYISKYSALAPLLPGYKEESFPPRILTESEHYLTHLGFPKSATINIDILKFTLTPQEKTLLDCLCQNTGKITTFDQAAIAVWGDSVDAKFSLYALAKIVESLRQKIKASGINRELIHTHRKQGYLFSN